MTEASARTDAGKQPIFPDDGKQVEVCVFPGLYPRCPADIPLPTRDSVSDSSLSPRDEADSVRQSHHWKD